MSNGNNSMDEALRSAAVEGDVARLERAIGAGANLEGMDQVGWDGVGWCGVV